MHVVLRRCSSLLTAAWDWFKASSWPLLVLATIIFSITFIAAAVTGSVLSIGGAFLGSYILAVAERNFNYKVDK